MIGIFIVLYFIFGAFCALAEFTNLNAGATWLGVFGAWMLWPFYIAYALVCVITRFPRRHD